MAKQDKALSSEQERAIEDANCIAYSDMYFGARSPLMDTSANRNFYEAGFKAACRAASPQLPVAQMGGDARERFEREYLGGNKQTARRNERGDYVLPSIQDAWSGWDAASHPSNAAGQDAPVARKVTYVPKRGKASQITTWIPIDQPLPDHRELVEETLLYSAATVPKVVQAPDYEADLLSKLPSAVIEAERVISGYFNSTDGKHWALGGIQKRAAAPIVATVPSEQIKVIALSKADGEYVLKQHGYASYTLTVIAKDGSINKGDLLYAAPSTAEQASDRNQLVDEALAKIATLGTIGAMKWLGGQYSNCSAPIKQSNDVKIIVCEVGDYGSINQQMATVIYDDKKIAECYTNEDAILVGEALRKSATPADNGNAPAEAKGNQS